VSLKASSRQVDGVTVVDLSGRIVLGEGSDVLREALRDLVSRGQKKILLNPEYGGDGKTVGRCSEFSLPAVAFPAHWAPVDLMFYSGKQFPQRFRGGALIAFHGSWNRAPMPQDGYNITFQAFSGGKPSGDFEVFARGFAGKTPLMNPGDAVARPDGVAEGPDGSLYITDSQKGKVWRVIYQGTK